METRQPRRLPTRTATRPTATTAMSTLPGPGPPEDIAWGIFNVPEQQLGVLGDVTGLDVVELGCGTAYFSAWLARRGARPTGVDLTAAQLATARRCQQRSGHFLSRASGRRRKCPAARRAVSTWPSRNAVPACGATRPAGYPRPPGCCGQQGGWSSTPRASWPPCAARNRPGPPAANCCARSGRGPAGWYTAGGGTQFHPGHGEWIADPASQRLCRR